MAPPPQGLEHHGREVGIVGTVGMPVRRDTEPFDGRRDALLRLRGLECPGRDPQVHALDGRQIREREGRNFRFDITDALRERRFGNARGSHRSRLNDPARVRALALDQARQHVLDE